MTPGSGFIATASCRRDVVAVCLGRDGDSTGIRNGASSRPEGVEPPTCGSEVRRSVQLSYGRTAVVSIICRPTSGASPILRRPYPPRRPPNSRHLATAGSSASAPFLLAACPATAHRHVSTRYRRSCPIIPTDQKPPPDSVNWTRGPPWLSTDLSGLRLPKLHCGPQPCVMDQESPNHSAVKEDQPMWGYLLCFIQGLIFKLLGIPFSVN
jgi:hypothetical protein